MLRERAHLMLPFGLVFVGRFPSHVCCEKLALVHPPEAADG